MLKLPRSTNQTLVLAVGLVAFANLGCATTIAGKYPHLDRRSVCIRVPGIEQDSAEWIYSDDNVPISNFHPEVIDRVAPTARTVFEFDPNADPLSPRYLPPPYDRLQCPERFSMLPSSEPQQSPLPEASLDLYVHKPRSESKRVPDSVAEKLANCPSVNAARLGAISYTVNFNVYVTDDGQAVSAYVQQSTLGDRDAEACLVAALRTTQWPVPEIPAVAAVPRGARMFFAQPDTVEPAPDSVPESGIRLRSPVAEPQGGPRPFIVTVPLIGPLVVGAIVFVSITIWPSKLAPAWSAEINPITQQPYTSPEEYEEVQRLSAEEIKKRQQARIKATQPQAPPAPAPSPTPQPQPTPAPQTQPDCPRSESFTPRTTHNATGCFDKKGNLQCYAGRHYPCAGAHTHGRLRYQEIRRGVCVEIDKEAVRCEGSFTVSGPCGSVSTAACRDGGPYTSGIHLER